MEHYLSQYEYAQNHIVSADTPHGEDMTLYTIPVPVPCRTRALGGLDSHNLKNSPFYTRVHSVAKDSAYPSMGTAI